MKETLLRVCHNEILALCKQAVSIAQIKNNKSHHNIRLWVHDYVFIGPLLF